MDKDKIFLDSTVLLQQCEYTVEVIPLNPRKFYLFFTEILNFEYHYIILFNIIYYILVVDVEGNFHPRSKSTEIHLRRLIFFSI